MQMSFDLSEALWRFDTARYTVAFFVEPEEMDPAESFSSKRDVTFARQGGSHWFSAAVAVFDKDENEIACDYLGGCSYRSFREFYSGHRWQWQPGRGIHGHWVTDPKSPTWKALDAKRPRRSDGSRADGWYFPDMVRTAISKARTVLGMQRDGLATVV